MTITKRNGKYYCRFQIDGERHHYLCSGATSMKEAEKMEAAFKYKVQQQQNGVIAREDKAITFKKLCDIYWKYAQANNSDLKHVKSKIKYFKEYFGENKEIHKIKPIDVESYKQYLINSGLKPATVNKYRSALMKMFNVGIENDMLLKNPCKSWKKLTEDNIKTVYWTDAEIKKFYEHSPEWLSDLVYLALSTGLRKANIRLFEKQWIDFEEGVIRVPRTQNKGKKNIILPINKELRKFLLNKVNEGNGKYLFISKERNTPHCDKKIDEYFAETCKKAKIKNIGFHGLRHTVGTKLGDMGVDIVVIKELLAHTSLATTERYRHNTEEKLRSAMDVLNSYN